jgi:voltage-gated potassium channel
VYALSAIRAALAEIRKVARGRTPTHARLRDILTVLVVATVGIDLVCALLILMFERHVPGSQIHTFGSSLFWCSAQLLTVSSQLPNPLSAGGRILDVAMEAYAITVVGTLAGSIGTFLIRRARETDEPPNRAGRPPAE